MNKYIAQLVESFFDDIDDEIFDNDKKLSDINILTSLNNLKLSDCETIDDIFKYIIIKSKFIDFINEYKYKLIQHLTLLTDISIYDIKNTDFNHIPDPYTTIRNNEFIIHIRSSIISLIIKEVPQIDFSFNFYMADSVLYIRTYAGMTLFVYPLAKIEKDNIIYYDFTENNLIDVFKYYYTHNKVSSFHLWCKNTLRNNKL